MLPFIMLFEVVLSDEPVDEIGKILQCDWPQNKCSLASLINTNCSVVQHVFGT